LIKTDDGRLLEGIVAAARQTALKARPNFRRLNARQHDLAKVTAAITRRNLLKVFVAGVLQTPTAGFLLQLLGG
jgi:hypothetical protein